MKLNILVAGLAVYVMATGIKIGSKGKVLPVGEALGQMTKSEARKVRKELFALGRTKDAAATRLVQNELRRAA